MGSSDHWLQSFVNRLRQGFESLAGTRADTPFPPAFMEDVAPAVVQLWESRSDFDRAHMKAVAADLAHQGVSRDIILAGLLHDIGKPARASTAVRTMLVVLNQLGPNVVPWLIRVKATFPGRESLMALAEHAEIGAAFLNRHAVSERIVWLVRYHHQERIDDEGLMVLQTADDRH